MNFNFQRVKRKIGENPTMSHFSAPISVDVLVALAPARAGILEDYTPVSSGRKCKKLFHYFDVNGRLNWKKNPGRKPVTQVLYRGNKPVPFEKYIFLRLKVC